MVDSDQAERGVPVSPFVVVQKRPVQVTLHVDAVVDGLLQVSERLTCVLDAGVAVNACFATVQPTFAPLRERTMSRTARWASMKY